MGRKDSQERKDRRQRLVDGIKRDLLIDRSVDDRYDDPVGVSGDDLLGSMVDGLLDGPLDMPMWLDGQGVHAMIPGEKPDGETLERMTLDYQSRIRQSPMFDELVKTYGLEKAEALLKQCRVELQ